MTLKTWLSVAPFKSHPADPLQGTQVNLLDWKTTQRPRVHVDTAVAVKLHLPSRQMMGRSTVHTKLKSICVGSEQGIDTVH